MAHTSRVRFSQRLVALVGIVALLQLAVAPGMVDGARAQATTIELDEVTAAIRGQDVTIFARTSTEVDGMKLFIRNLLDLGPFSELQMEKTGTYNWRYTLPLSQQQGELGRLEYYVEAYQGGQPVAKTENFVISFIEPPFIGDVTVREEPGLPKDDWKAFIKGRISRPLYKRWWVYAIAGAIAIPVTAVLAGGDEAPEIPVTLTMGIREEAAVRAGTFGVLCPENPVPVFLEIRAGEPPFDIIFTAENGGVNTIDQIGSPGTERIVQGGVMRGVQAGEGALTRVEFSYPPFTVQQDQSNNQNPVIFRAIVRDNASGSFSSNPVEGQALPEGIENDILNDTRIRDVIKLDVFVTNASAGSFLCPNP